MTSGRPHPHWLFRARLAADRDGDGGGEAMTDGGRERLHEWARDWHEARQNGGDDR